MTKRNKSTLYEPINERIHGALSKEENQHHLSVNSNKSYSVIGTQVIGNSFAAGGSGINPPRKCVKRALVNEEEKKYISTNERAVICVTKLFKRDDELGLPY